jgi:hypothetical protein
MNIYCVKGVAAYAATPFTQSVLMSMIKTDFN